MSTNSINLFRIEKSKLDDFVQTLRSKFKSSEARIIPVDGSEITLNFYYKEPENEKPVSWSWISEKFGKELHQKSYPSAVLLIGALQGENTYAVSFGTAYFTVHKFCDKDFGLSFARKFQPIGVQSATYTSPKSKKNKTINTYLNQNEFLFEGGQSYNKLRFRMDFSEFNQGKENHLNETISVGTSVNFTFNDSPNLEQIIQLVKFAEDSVENLSDMQKIPLFLKVSDPEKKDELDALLAENLANFDNFNVQISELKIIGAKEVFASHNACCEILYRRTSEELSELSLNTVNEFCKKQGIILSERYNQLKLKSKDYGYEIPLKQCLDFICEEKQCLLMDGEWFSFNQDFQDYLNDSLSSS